MLYILKSLNDIFISKGTRQTLFLVVDQGFSSRYLLRTDIFRTLKNSGAKIVILSPNGDEKYFKKEFEDVNVKVEEMDVDAYERYNNSKNLARLLRRIRWYSTNGKFDTHTVDMRYSIYRKIRPKRTVFHKIFNAAFDTLVAVLRKYKSLRQIEISLESFFYTPKSHQWLFKKYRPDKLVITSLGIFGYDHFMIREAKRNGTKVIALILSWDNTSSKGMAGAHVDHVIAWSYSMQNELMNYYDFDINRIPVVGVAHFDNHFRKTGLWNKDELCHKLKLSKDKKIIFYALKSPNRYQWNPEIVEFLAAAIEDDRFAVPCQLLVRIHPISFRSINGRYRFSEEIERHKELDGKYKDLVYDYPDVRSEKLDFDMPSEEMIKLSSILKHSDVVLSYFSTVMLEACIFDVPCVNVALHSHTSELDKDDLKIVNAPHIKRIIQTGGVRSAYNYDDLIKMINLYLTDRRLEINGRKIIVQNEAVVNAGQAGERIGEEIVRL